METFSTAPELASDQPPTDHVEAGMEYCRRVLLSLVEMGHELTAMVVQEARSVCDHATPAPTQEAAAAYASVTRSIRRTVMLYEKLGTPKKPRQNRVAARKKIIRDVEDAIEREAPEGEQESLHAELMERLDRPDLEQEIADRATGEIVTDITRDLGLAGLDGTHPWKRRIPHDIAILNARAAQLPGAAPSAELLTLLAAAPPRPPPPLDPDDDDDDTVDVRILAKRLRRLRES